MEGERLGAVIRVQVPHENVHSELEYDWSVSLHHLSQKYSSITVPLVKKKEKKDTQIFLH